MDDRRTSGKVRWRVLEFYSGIGGMRYSLIEAGIDADVVEAFDINDVANDVYEFNFGHRPFQGNIQSLTAADLDRYGANAWLLSPPCQPYTRQGLQKHSGDARAFSFLRILELIPQLLWPPIMLFVENVVGFETSDTHAKMIETLRGSGFITQEFILSPLQFRVPYSRPRYFCLAKRKPSCFRSSRFNDMLIWSPSPLFLHDSDPVTDDCVKLQDDGDQLLDSCQPVEHFLEFKSAVDHKKWEFGFEGAKFLSGETRDSSDGTDERDGSSPQSLDQYLVPVSLIKRWGSAMDIVYPDSRRCCCFTKSYYRYVKGTGSLLATLQPIMKDEAFPLEEQRLRYFTPREVANFHSFPKHFDFPEHVSLKQRYALLGNSLSIAVVAPLLYYLFTEPSWHPEIQRKEVES